MIINNGKVSLRYGDSILLFLSQVSTSHNSTNLIPAHNTHNIGDSFSSSSFIEFLGQNIGDPLLITDWPASGRVRVCHNWCYH